MNRVPVHPELLRWARERAGYDVNDLARRMPGLPAWERGEKQPTMKQLERFAKVTHVPLGYLFLPAPPEERLPIPDFRTLQGKMHRPSPNLLDTIHAMQRRQAWLREDQIECEAEPLDFVGSARLTDNPDAIGREMRRMMSIDGDWAAEMRTWREAVGSLRRTIEHFGIMAVINGVVENNTKRTLNVEEFRGFSLCDHYAPLIFVNGADAKSAQMFTLAHELAHIWLGPAGEGISGFENISPGGTETEVFCDRAAAEFFLPARELKLQWGDVKRESQPFKILARRFKISPVVAGRRALDLRLIDREEFFSFYNEHVNTEQRHTARPGGGNFYNNQDARVGQVFAAKVMRAAKEGRLGFREAYSLTGLRGGTFQAYAAHLGFDRAKSVMPDAGQ